MIHFRIEDNSVALTVESAVTVGISGKTYGGSYEIIPTVEEQTMETKNKYMTDDVKIKSIPFYDVGNNSGGSTVYIGTLEELTEKGD